MLKLCLGPYIHGDTASSNFIILMKLPFFLHTTTRKYYFDLLPRKNLVGQITEMVCQMIAFTVTSCSVVYQFGTQMEYKKFQCRKIPVLIK